MGSLNISEFIDFVHDTIWCAAGEVCFFFQNVTCLAIDPCKKTIGEVLSVGEVKYLGKQNVI